MSHAGKLSVRVQLYIALTLFFWGSAFVAIRVGLHGYSPGPLALLRYIIGSLCMLIPYWQLSHRNRISHRDKISMLILGMVSVGMYHLCLNYGEMQVQAGIASFIISQSPIITVLLAYIFLKERLTTLAFMGMAVSTIGMILILLAEDKTLEVQMDCLFILISCIAGGASSVFQKIYLKKYHFIEVTAYFSWGGLLSLVLYLPTTAMEIQHAGLWPNLAMIYLGLFPTTVASVAWSYVLVHMTATRSTNFLYLMPLVATLIGWVGLGETPGYLALGGGLLALCGIWLVNHGHKAARG